MSLDIYLFFDGNCAEAFDFYKSVFGGDITMKSTFADAPDDMPVGDDDKDKLMHVSFPIGDDVLMGSDVIQGFGGTATAGNNFAISYSPANREEADRVFPMLTNDGDVMMPLQETFWGSYYGMGTDKFGIRWMVNVQLSGD